MKIKNLAKFSFLFLVVLTVPVAFRGQAHAATMSVNSVSDSSDAIAGDGICDDGLGDCTLRAAMEEANALPGADTVDFNIPGVGVHTISPSSALPQITDSITLDALSQPGSSCGTLVPASFPTANTPHSLLIEIDSTNIASGFGIYGVLALTDANASNSVIRGFVINRNTVSATYVNASFGVTSVSDVSISCNYLGTDPTGEIGYNSSAPGFGAEYLSDNIIFENNLVSSHTYNGVDGSSANNLTIKDNIVGLDSSGTYSLGNLTGVTIHGDQNTISHNVISGNSNIGLNISDTIQATVVGNIVGLGLDGSPIGNDDVGVEVFAAAQAVIGGDNSTERNIISANGSHGIRIYNNCNSTLGAPVGHDTVTGNYIGVTLDGTMEDGYGNGGSGIVINENNGSCATVSDIRIGATEDGSELNIIAGNSGSGVLIYQTPNTDVRDIAILVNSIHDNGGLGIDLAADADDDGEPDDNLGVNIQNNYLITLPNPVANSFVNAPIIKSLQIVGNNVIVNYDLAANKSDGTVDIAGYRLDFYANQSSDSTGYGEGKTHLGYFIVDGSENGATHTFEVSDINKISGLVSVSATTTVLLN